SGGRDRAPLPGRVPDRGAVAGGLPPDAHAPRRGAGRGGRRPRTPAGPVAPPGAGTRAPAPAPARSPPPPRPATPRHPPRPRRPATAALLARAGFAVAVPELPALRAQHLRPSDARVVRETLDRLAASPGVRRGPVAVIAVSVGLAPVALALDDAVMANRVRL